METAVAIDAPFSRDVRWAPDTSEKVELRDFNRTERKTR